jgi:hypothetical protein
MKEQQLTKREILIEQILHMSDAELTKVYDLVVETMRQNAHDTTRDDERLWDVQFASSQDELAKLADEALAEHRAGKTRPFPQ